MLSLDDTIWSALLGAYGTPYDPRSALEQLLLQPDRAELRAELGEQLVCDGKVGSASYAAVPHLLKAGYVGLAARIECARYEGMNGPPPRWMLSDYEGSWTAFFENSPWSDQTPEDQVLLARIADQRERHGEDPAGFLPQVSEDRGSTKPALNPRPF